MYSASTISTPLYKQNIQSLDTLLHICFPIWKMEQEVEQ